MYGKEADYTHFSILNSDISLCMYYRGNSSSRFPNNSEANASELLENLEEMMDHEHVIVWNLSSNTSVSKGLKKQCHSNIGFNDYILSSRFGARNGSS